MQQEIRSVISKHQLCFLGIAESRVRDSKIPQVSYIILPQYWKFHTNIQHCSFVRIWLCWSPNVSVEILFDTDQVVHCRLHGEGVIFLLSICYGRNVVQEREPLWEFLNSIVALSNLPWIALRGSNIVIWNSEKRGGASPWMRAMEAFNNCIDRCGLIELPLAGHALARSNSSEGDQRIECKLDRSLVNNNFILNGANYEVTILCPGLSNHHQIFFSKDLAAGLQEPNPS